MRRACEQFLVVYVEEPVFQDDVEAHLLLQRDGDVLVAVPVLDGRAARADDDDIVSDLVDALVDELPPASWRVNWYYSPAGIRVVDPLSADVVVYDNMDELSLFKGASADLLELEDELLASADLVFTGGQSLYEAKRHRHDAIHAFPSSIDAAHFAVARQGLADPADQAGIAGPRLGFFGVVDERLDTNLLAALAAVRPDWQFVMIGPVVKIDPAGLPRAANIHWLGGKAYRELPAYLANWDVGIMPFAINEATRFISPTKTPEFLAAGLPVVSTPIRDVVRPYGVRGLVGIGHTVEAFERACAQALASTDPGWRERVDDHLAQGSWDKTWAAMLALVEATTPGGMSWRAAARDTGAGSRLAATAARGGADV